MTTSLRAVVRDHAHRVGTAVIVWAKNVAATPRRAGESERKGDERESVSGLVAVATLLKDRSEEHTSELQSRLHLVCRLLLEKKKKNKNTNTWTDSRQVK